MQGPVSFKFVESFRPRPLGEAHTTFFQQSPQKELLCFIILLLPDILFCKGRLRTLVSTVKSTSSLLPEALRCGGGPDYLPLSRSGFLALGTDESERPNHVGLIDFLQQHSLLGRVEHSWKHRPLGHPTSLFTLGDQNSTATRKADTFPNNFPHGPISLWSQWE